MMNEPPALLLHKLVWVLDRAADQLLRTELDISYKRALFLHVLQYHGTITQHELAIALGYSDPAVSMMLLELAKDGYVETAPSPKHGRKRLVSITPKGSDIVIQGRQLLDSRFERLMETAGVDIHHYHELTERIYQTLVASIKKENHDQ
jgi:DNA-binding MarR family transcriptional regulator